MITAMLTIAGGIILGVIGLLVIFGIGAVVWSIIIEPILSTIFNKDDDEYRQS